MKVPIKKGKNFSWSPSSYKTFKTCQLKAWGTYWTPNPPPYEQSPAAIYGEKVHKALELAVQDGTPLPPELSKLQKWVDAVNHLPGVKSCEGKVAFDKNWNRVEYFDRNAWGRMVVDLIVYTSDKSAAIFDWKTGKSRFDTPEQILFGMISVKNLNPSVEHFKGAYIYTEENKVGDMIVHNTDSLSKVKLELQKDIAVMEKAFNTGEFEPTKNGLCKNYCSVVECPFHGT